jgi:hypothetical protein
LLFRFPINCYAGDEGHSSGKRAPSALIMIMIFVCKHCDAIGNVHFSIVERIIIVMKLVDSMCGHLEVHDGALKMAV